MDWLADISLIAAFSAGVLLICGFLLVANRRDARNARHPGGARGRLRDELIVVAPVVPILSLPIVGALLPDLRSSGWWILVIFACMAVLGLGFTTVAKKARHRLAALRGEPAQ